MTEQQSEDQQPTETTAQVECSRPGELLRKAREAKGLTQNEVAKKLNFLPIYIPSLENEDFKPLHSVTFVKGYLRAYARFLGIDANEVMHCFAMHHSELVAEETQQTVEIMKPEKNTSSLVFKFISLLIVIALIAIIIIWWQSRTAEPMPSVGSQEVQVDTLDGNTIVAPVKTEEEIETETTTSDQKLEDEIAAELQAAQEETQLAVEKKQAELAAVEKVKSTPEQTEVENPTPVAKVITGDPAATTAGNARLVALSFEDECWVEVRDNEGGILHAALMQADDKILLEGEPPFRMVFGFGEAANVFYKGQVFDFSSRIRPNGYASIRVE